MSTCPDLLFWHFLNWQTFVKTRIYLLRLCSPSRLKSQCCDEDVDKNSKEHKYGCYIIQCVQPRPFLNIIQVVLHWRKQEKTHQCCQWKEVRTLSNRRKLTDEDEQEADNDLQGDGQWDQSDKRGVEAVLMSWMQHGLQLRGVGHQKSHIQHALCCTLLSSVMIHVEGTLLVPSGKSLRGSEHYILTFSGTGIWTPEHEISQ